VEGSSPDGSPSGGTPGDSATIIEGASADSSTIIEGTQARAEAGFNLVPGGQFQGHTLLKPLQVTSGEADLWFIADQEGKEYVLKLYRWGIKPKEEIAAKIKALRREHIVEVLADGETGGRHYEVLEKIEHGSLVDLINAGQLGDRQLKESVRELGSAVSHLHEAGIIHRDIKPANVLVRGKDPLNLILTDFGISSVSDVSLHMTSVNRTAAYCAPEAMQGVVAKASDWWSVGVIVLEMLQGRHPFAGMDERAVNFQLVARGISIPEDISSDWQLVLKGLLTRDPGKRWGWDEVEQWLTGKRDIATQYEGDQKEEKKFGYRPYKLRRREIYEPEELAIYLGENWNEGVKHFGRGYISDWVKDNYQDHGLASDLTDIFEDTELDADQKLSAALLVLNEDLPLFWKGEVVSRDWLLNDIEQTQELCVSRMLYYFDLHRSEDELKLGEIAGRVKEVAEDKGLEGEVQDLVFSLAVDSAYPLKLGEELIDSQEWMAAHPKEAMKVLKGPLPAWQERLTGKTSLMLEAERLEAERLEAERLEAERLEAERLEAERLEAKRLEAERLEAERLEIERRDAAWRALIGKKLWEFETGGPVHSSPAIGSDGTVYVGSKDKKLYAINGKSGVKLWEFETGWGVRSSPAIGSNGTVYVGSYDNKLYAIQTESLGPAQSPWPMRGQNALHTGRASAVNH
jgi:serine/threonine protein kinase